MTKCLLVCLHSAVAISLAGLEPYAQAQCPAVPDHADATGDSTYNGIHTPTVSQLRASATERVNFLIDDWSIHNPDSTSGWKRLVDGTSCPVPAGGTSHWDNVDCASRRLLNAAQLLYEVDYFGSSSWHSWIDTKIAPDDDFKLSLRASDCAAGQHGAFCPGFAVTDICPEGNPYDTIYLMSLGIFTGTILERASVIVHEARHVDGEHHCEYGDVCPLLNADLSWAEDGAFRRQIEFIEQALTTTWLTIPSAVRAETVSEANQLLSSAFYYHPGFVFDVSEIYGYDVSRVNWNLATGLVELAFFQGPDLPSWALYRFDLASKFTDDAISGSPARDAAKLRVCGQLLEALPGRNVAFHENDCRQFVLGTAGTPGAELGVGINATPITPQNPVVSSISVGGRSGPTGIDRLAAAGGSLRSNVLVPTGFVGDVGSGSIDSVATATSGHFISGFGFGINDSNGNVGSLAIATSLGPQFERRGGGNGGTHKLLECNAEQIPIGLRLSSVGLTNGTTVVSYFGLICADMVRLWCPSCETASSRRIARPSFADPYTGVYHPATTSPQLASSENFQGVQDYICPSNSMLRGLVLQAGEFVDAVTQVRCSNGAAISFSVGGAGGNAFIQDCWQGDGPAYNATTRTYSPLIYARAGHWLDSVAVGCVDAYDFAEDFESANPSFWHLRSDGFSSGLEGVLPGSPNQVRCFGSDPNDGVPACAGLTFAPVVRRLLVPHLDLRHLRGQLLRISFRWYYRGPATPTPPNGRKFFAAYLRFDDHLAPNPSEILLWSKPDAFSQDAWQTVSAMVSLPARASVPQGEVVQLVVEVGPTTTSSPWLAAIDDFEVVSEW